MHRSRTLTVSLLLICLALLAPAVRAVESAHLVGGLFDSPLPGVPQRIFLPLILQSAPSSLAPADAAQSKLQLDSAWKMALSAPPRATAPRWPTTGPQPAHGYDGGTDAVSYSAGYQDVVIPAGAEQVTLNFWWYPLSAEADRYHGRGRTRFGAGAGGGRRRPAGRPISG